MKHIPSAPAFFIAGLLALGVAGCQSPNAMPPGQADMRSEVVLREGDVIKISFPGAPNLDSPAQPIRRDGKITLPIVGEAPAAGFTPSELQHNLMQRFASQLQSKDVLVTVVSSSFDVYVDGPVNRPGKVSASRPLTILDALMEAGGPASKADLKNVTVVRRGEKENSYYHLNVKDMISGKDRRLFYLAPGDIVHVPEKLSLW